MTVDAQLVEQAIAAVVRPQSRSSATGRVRRARTLVLVIEDGLVGLNYLNNTCEDCSRTTLAVLEVAGEWQPPEALVAGSRAGWTDEVVRLLRIGWLVVEGTRAASHDETFEQEWEWDVRAGLFNLAIKDPPIMTTADQVTDLETRVIERAPIPLYTTNAERSSVIALGPPDLTSGVFPSLTRRRTYREFSATPVPRDALRDCLFAGLGITGFVQSPIAGIGELPLKLTPSGGARNPFEAYVWVGNVADLPAGFYHYSAIDGTLGLVAPLPLPRPSELLCDQEWWDGAGAVVFLVASFQRTMWKYEHPMAYRAVLIEAGHIAQNVMIAAAHHGLSAGPTAFLRDALLEEILGLDRVVQSVVYALVLGEPTAERRTNPRSADERISRGY